MHVSANVAISLDGRLAPADGARIALGSRCDLDRLSLRRTDADAVLVGGATFRTWTLPYVADPRALERLGHSERGADEGPRTWWNVILTRSGPLPTEAARFWDDPRVRPLVLSCAPLVLPRGENLVRAEWTPEEILDVLRERGVERLLIEGGGGLLGPFLAKGRVDRLHLTLCPQVLGGDQGLAGPMRWTFAQAPRMRLTACEPVGDEVYVTYERA